MFSVHSATVFGEFFQLATDETAASISRFNMTKGIVFRQNVPVLGVIKIKFYIFTDFHKDD